MTAPCGGVGASSIGSAPTMQIAPPSPARPIRSDGLAAARCGGHLGADHRHPGDDRLAALSVPAIRAAWPLPRASRPRWLGTYISLVYPGIGRCRTAHDHRSPARRAATVPGRPRVVRRWRCSGHDRDVTGVGDFGLVPGLGYGPITPASSHMLARSTDPHRIALTFSVKQNRRAGRSRAGRLLVRRWRSGGLAGGALDGGPHCAWPPRSRCSRCVRGSITIADPGVA